MACIVIVILIVLMSSWKGEAGEKDQWNSNKSVSETTSASEVPLSFQRKVNTEVRLDGVDGKTSTLYEYLKHGAVYIDFWALWCDPCKQQLRAMKKFINDNPNLPLTLLAINLDSPKSLAKVKAYVKSQNYPFPVFLDPNMQVFQTFNGQQIPFSVLIDRTGKMVSMRTGYFPGDEKEIEKEILKLIPQE